MSKHPAPGTPIGADFGPIQSDLNALMNAVAHGLDDTLREILARIEGRIAEGGRA